MVEEREAFCRTTENYFSSFPTSPLHFAFREKNEGPSATPIFPTTFKIAPFSFSGVHLLPVLPAPAVAVVLGPGLPLLRPLPLPDHQHLHDVLRLHDGRRRGQQVPRHHRLRAQVRRRQSIFFELKLLPIMGQGKCFCRRSDRLICFFLAFSDAKSLRQIFRNSTP